MKVMNDDDILILKPITGIKFTSSRPGLFGELHLPYEVDRDTSLEGTPSLEEMTMVALQRLKQEDKGFFLLVCAAFIIVMLWASMHFFFLYNIC